MSTFGVEEERVKEKEREGRRMGSGGMVGGDKVHYSRKGKMTDVNVTMKRWQNMEIDVLVQIFKELNMIELGIVSQVCRSWRLACSDPLLWCVLDLGLLKSNFIPTRASPYIYVDDRSDRILTQLLRTSMGLSCGSIACMIFHFNLYMKDIHLSYISERSPHTKRIVLPAWNCITKNAICQAIRRWEDLESMTMPSIAYLPHILKQLRHSCKNFSELKIMGTFDKKFAVAIANNVPKLKVLSVRCSMLAKDALLFILDYMEHLEMLNISHCLLMEGSTISSSFVQNQIIKGFDSIILEKASRLKEFFYCQDTSCLTCKRMIKDEGFMRWYLYEDWFWRKDEINSLNLVGHGKLFDMRCMDLILPE